MNHEQLDDIAYRHFVESVKDYAIYMLNVDGTVATWNEGAFRAKGYTREEIVGRYFGVFYSEAEQLAGLPAHNLELALRNGKYEGEGWRYRKDGSRFWAHVLIDAIYDDRNTLLGFAKVTRDISEQRVIQDEISAMARHDALTGLPNRAELFAFSETLFSANAYRHIAICTVDLDKFKDINELAGHQAGDRLLKYMASAIGKIIGKDEMAARFDGDEFVVVKPFNQAFELDAFCERLYRCCSGKFPLGNREITVDASIGVSVYPQEGTDINALIGNSELAMLRAKGNLVTKICRYEREMDDKTRRRNMMAVDIRRGINEGQFFIHYQEKRALKDKSITGYEALLRWCHPVHGLIPPDIFIPIAEESGAIVPLGYWVIENVCAESLANQINKKISINVSPIQLSHYNFIDKVRDILKHNAYPLSLLEFEVTESAFIMDKSLTYNILRQFQKMGISIVLDDFGTGYSSLGTLRDFHFDAIKLDRSFLTDVENSVQARSFVRAIVSLSNAIDTPLIAEGVETREQLRILEEEGCDEIQGFLFSRPVDIKHLHR